MAKQMKLWVVCALVLTVGGAAMASNMGFKFVPNLNQSGKIFTISLPINNNYTNAAAVLTDMQSSGCTPQKIERINPSVGGTSRTFWTGSGTAAQNFTISKGEGYLVQVTGSCTSWVVVGSHDPTYSYSISQPGKVYMVSIPYHTTAQVANDLLTSIPNASKIERINPSVGGTSRTFWTGSGTAAQNFPVTIGESYLVVVTAASTWTPAHY